MSHERNIRLESYGEIVGVYMPPAPPMPVTCQTLSFDYVSSLVERLASLKYNAILLEWGDKFPYQGHRVLVHPDAFSTRQVSQLLELCESLGVVVIPLVQTLGHVEFILRHPQFAHLSEVPGEVYQLATGNPESLVLAKQLVDQIIESHPASPYVHLGADETTQLGAGVSAEQVSRKGKSLAWVDYMNVICRHVQARGRTPIVWDDMPLAYPQALNRFTRDCLLMHWNYSTTTSVAADYWQPGIGNVNAKRFREMDAELRQRYEPFWSQGGAKPPKTFYTQAPVAYLRQAGFRLIVAPAVRSFGDSYSAPRLRQHIDNCFQMAEAAAEHHCLGLMVTNWSVRRTPVETTFAALAAAAEAAWNGGARPSRDLDASLAETVFGAHKTEIIAAMDTVGRQGNCLFNGIGGGSAWDRRHDRWGIAPLLVRLRKADLPSLTASSDAVKLARRLQRESAAAGAKLARIATHSPPAAASLAAWKFAAHETHCKANQWLFLWQVARLVRIDRGSPEPLARQGTALLEEIRRCIREFKRSAGPSLLPSGVQEELEVHFSHEVRLVRRLVRTLRTKMTRAQLRDQLGNTLGIRTSTADAERQ